MSELKQIVNRETLENILYKVGGDVSMTAEGRQQMSDFITNTINTFRMRGAQGINMIGDDRLRSKINDYGLKAVNIYQKTQNMEAVQQYMGINFDMLRLCMYLGIQNDRECIYAIASVQVITENAFSTLSQMANTRGSNSIGSQDIMKFISSDKVAGCGTCNSSNKQLQQPIDTTLIYQNNGDCNIL